MNATRRSSQEESLGRYRRYMKAEQEAVGLYTAMAGAEKDSKRKALFQELVESERRHAMYWAAKLGIALSEKASVRRTLRVHAVGWLARRLGTKRMLSLVMRLEGDDSRIYGGDPEAAHVVGEEAEHFQKLQTMQDGLRHPQRQARTTQAWESAASAGAFRAGVLGVNDGLVSNFALVWGVAGGTSDTQIILLAGVAGLLAGAFSMAAGEYVSMRADRDLSEYRIEKARKELEEFPEEEREEISLIYRLKGLTKAEADLLAARVMQSKEIALDTMVREQLGLDPHQLGSPTGAAVSSFVAFSAGAFVPLFPYLLSHNSGAFLISGVLTGVALLFVGSLLAYFSKKNAAWGGLRMLLFGAVAGAITNGIGRLVGVAVQ